MSAVDVGAMYTKRTCPLTSMNGKVIQARYRRYQQKAMQVLGTKMSEGKTGKEVDMLLSKVVSSKVVRSKRAYPETASLTSLSENLKKLGENASTLVHKCGKHNLGSVVHFLVDGLPKQWAMKSLGISAHTIWNSSKKGQGTSLTSQNYATDVNRNKITAEEGELLREFFIGSTGVFSGARSTTRHLEIPEHEWEARLYADWPSILRQACTSNPELLEAHQPLTEKERKKGLSPCNSSLFLFLFLPLAVPLSKCTFPSISLTYTFCS